MESFRDYATKPIAGVPVFVVALLLIPPVFAAIGYTVGLSAPVSDIRLFLSTLATAQAGVLAIVFSVTIIGVQLVSTEYSPRMISLFTQSSILVFTFCIFVASIAFDLVLLLNLTIPQQRLVMAGVWAAGGFGIVSAVTLFVFIRRALYQSTPEGTMEAFLEDMTTESYVEGVRESVDDDFRHAHPMRPLYSMVMSALSSRERATAELGLERYGERCLEILDECSERGVIEQEKRQVARELFNPVLKEHLHDIALHAEDQDEIQLISESIGFQYKIGCSGLEIDTPMVSRQSVRGLTQVIIHAPVEHGEYSANDIAWRKLGELLSDASEYPRAEVTRQAVSTISTRAPYTMSKAHKTRPLRYSMTDLFQHMRIAQENILEHFEEDIARVDLDWKGEHPADDVEHRERIMAMHEWQDAMTSISAAVLRHVENKDEYPITEGNFVTVWENVCTQASNTTANEYGVALCQAMIETAFIDSSMSAEGGLNWGSKIGRVMYNGDTGVVEEAFKRMLSYEFKEEAPPLGVIGEDFEDRREEYYNTQVSVQDYSPLNTNEDFPELVRDLRESARKTSDWLSSQR